MNVEHSRRMAARYRELGFFDKSVRYFELPGVNHLAWDFAYRDASLFARLLPIRRNAFPDRVVYSTFSPRFNQAYWVRIHRIDRGFKLARIEATRRSSASSRPRAAAAPRHRTRTTSSSARTASPCWRATSKTTG